jgi:glutaredoxin
MTAPRVRLFYRPGCSSCARARELLESWGIEFDPVNVQADPAALHELDGLGPPLVPALVVGDRVIRGWNPRGCAALLGVDYEPAPLLPPSELGMMLERILAATERLIAEVPDARMEYRAPQSDRTIRDLAYHVFSLAAAFADGMDMGGVTPERLHARAPEELRDGRSIARYGALVRGRVGGWLEGAAPREFARAIETGAGLQSGHDWLERTAWHAAQHLRQLHALLEALGLPPREPLASVDLFRLPLPASLW